MRVLFFDTETTGLPGSKIISPDTIHLWPHIVQFSYIIYDTDLCSIVETFDYVVKMKKDIIIPEDSIKIHGVTNEMSDKFGVSIIEILNDFFYYLKTVDEIVGHNISFDINIIRVELLRLIYSSSEQGPKNDLTVQKYNLYAITNYKNIYCTMLESVDLCSIQAVSKNGKSYVKFPTLLELHEKLFGTKPQNLHNSLNDVIVTCRCYIKMKFGVDLLDFKG
jgi:DNA polymerase III epsilon subunit-like protein